MAAGVTQYGVPREIHVTCGMSARCIAKRHPARCRNPDVGRIFHPRSRREHPGCWQLYRSAVPRVSDRGAWKSP